MHYRGPICALVLTSSLVLGVTTADAQQTATEAMFAACNLEAEVVAAVGPTLSHTAHNASSVGQPDRLLEGMGTNGLEEPAYREAYRDCMRGRGF